MTRIREPAFWLLIGTWLIAWETDTVPNSAIWAVAGSLGVAVLAVCLLEKRFEGLGLAWGSWRRGASVLGIGLLVGPALAAGLLALDPAARAYYTPQSLRPLASEAASHGASILQAEVIFRGPVLFALSARLAVPVASILSSMVYALSHLDKPVLEAFAALPVGLALAAAAIWSRSIWYGFVAHVFGSLSLLWLLREGPRTLLGSQP